MKKTLFPPSEQVFSENLKRYQIGKQDPSVLESVANIPLFHVTAPDRVESILQSWDLLSISSLEKSGKWYHHMEINTDKLDKNLWLDKYIFSTLWRNAFHNWGSISFAFPSNKILNTPWVIASLKEISDHGALVSEEAELLFRETTWGDPWRQNRIATSKFLDGIIRWSDFQRVFWWFLQKHFASYLDYLTTLTYPGEILEVNPMGTMNVWGWPQIMIPQSLSLVSCKGIFTRTRDEANKIISQLSQYWYTIPVVSMEWYVIDNNKKFQLPWESTDRFIKWMNILAYESINM